MNKHTHTHTAAFAAGKTKEELVDAVIERMEKCGTTTEGLACVIAAFERRKAQIDSAKREAADVFTGVITPEECPADSAVRSELVRRFGAFARAVDTMRADRALAESDDERARIDARIANVIGWLRVVAPADAATGRPAGVLGDGRVTVSIEARVDAPGDGCGFAVEFIGSGDPVCELRFASLRDAMGALISAQLAADEVDEDEEDIEITFSDASADGNPRQFRARTRGLSLREARAALESGELIMFEV